MTASDSSSPKSRNPHLHSPEEGKSEVALRRQEAQALNRSFRRVAEVQQALLEYIQELEEERHSRRRWAVPMISGGALVFGAGLAFISFQWQADREAERLESLLPQIPNVVIEPAPVSVQVPQSAIDAEAVGALLAEMTSLRELRAEDRRTIGELSARLVESEERQLAFLRTVAASPDSVIGGTSAEASGSGDWGVPETAQSETLTAREAIQRSNPALDSLNALMAGDGYPWLRFQQGVLNENGAGLTDAVLLEWNPNGPLKSALVGGKVDFDLRVMTSTLVLDFQDGYRVQQGKRIPFASGGVRIDLTGIRPDVWIQEFPGLEESVAFVAPLSQEDFSMAQGVDLPILDKAVVREALNRFLTERRPAGYYRLTELGGVFGDRLEQVQIDWYNGSGRLVKTLAADSLQIILHPKGLWGSMGSVELVLTKGAFLEAGVSRPFFQDRFRLHLPRQDSEAWKASPIPLSDGNN